MLDFPFVRRHATGVTLGAFILVAVGLSLAPVPEWLVPLDLLQSEDPAHAFVAALLKQPDAIPLPDQLADQLQAEDPLPPDEVPPPPEVRASTVSAPRTTWQMPERPDVDRYAGRLGLVADPIENPCVAPGEGGACERRALSRFFGALERVERGDPGAVARIIHFGDSLIASDKISDRARLRLQQRFGSAGRGFLMAKRFNQFQRGQRSGRGSEGWELDVITASLKSLEDRHFGFSGASFTSKKSGETLTFEPIDESRFMRLYYLAHPEGTPLEVKADGALIETLETRADMAEGREYALELPEGTERLVLESTGPGARVYGLSLESSGSGVIWSTLGLPGATSEVWLRPDEAEAARLLSNREPSLAIIMLGGNDGLMLAKKRATAEELERDAAAFVDRVQAALPGADCMLVTPLEAVRAKGGGRLIPKPEVEVTPAMRTFSNGCLGFCRAADSRMTRPSHGPQPLFRSRRRGHRLPRF